MKSIVYFTACFLLLLQSIGAQINTETGVNPIATVQNGHIVIWNGNSWQRRFLTGMNLGATIPGHFPGEFAPTKEILLGWFQDCVDLDIDLLRIYTLWPPYFYDALAEFNRGRTNPLYVMHGIYSPEEELINGGPGADGWDATITNDFKENIHEIVLAVHGNITVPERQGLAYGTYTTDISPYVLGWVIGTEWHPETVQLTNMLPTPVTVEYQYIAPTPEASRFEKWLAYMLDYAAQLDMQFNWQRPISFTNWLTTDVLRHPLEPWFREELAIVDVAHVAPTSSYSGGYFGTFHVYPYYPDFLRYEYNQCLNCRGTHDPYAGYLNQLKTYYADIPIVVAEFGIPSSRSMSHAGPAGRHQGGHDESEQGHMMADLMYMMYEEGYDGGIIFALQDEWFKTSWNTLHFERNGHLWRNRLTNEEHFGILSMDPGRNFADTMLIDGQTADWTHRQNDETAIPVASFTNDNFNWKITHDESDLYLLVEKKNGGTWNFPSENLLIVFDVVTGGNSCPDSTFTTNVEMFLNLRDRDNSLMFVNSQYDLFYHTYNKTGGQSDDQPFEPSKIIVSYPMPVKQCRFPAEVLITGHWKFGITDPASPDFNSLADWFFSGSVLEVRFPWFLLGMMDPSSKLAIDYFPANAANLTLTNIEGISLEMVHLDANGNTRFEPSVYNWQGWTTPTWHQRRKASFEIISAMNRAIHLAPLDAACVPRFACQAQELTSCATMEAPGLVNVDPNQPTANFFERVSPCMTYSQAK